MLTLSGVGVGVGVSVGAGNRLLITDFRVVATLSHLSFIVVMSARRC